MTAIADSAPAARSTSASTPGADTAIPGTRTIARRFLRSARRLRVRAFGQTDPFVRWLMSMTFTLRAAGLIGTLLFIAGPASAQYAADKALAFQQRVDEAARMMDDSPRLRDLSHERRRGIVQFVAG